MQLMYWQTKLRANLQWGHHPDLVVPCSDPAQWMEQRLALLRAGKTLAHARQRVCSAKGRRIHGRLCDRCGYMREHRAVRHECSRHAVRESPLGNVIKIGDCLCEMTAWWTSTEHRRLRVASSW